MLAQVVRVLEGGKDKPAKVVIGKQNLNFLVVKGESSGGVVMGSAWG